MHGEAVLELTARQEGCTGQATWAFLLKAVVIEMARGMRLSPGALCTLFLAPNARSLNATPPAGVSAALFLKNT